MKYCGRASKVVQRQPNNVFDRQSLGSSKQSKKNAMNSSSKSPSSPNDSEKKIPQDNNMLTSPSPARQSPDSGDSKSKEPLAFSRRGEPTYTGNFQKKKQLQLHEQQQKQKRLQLQEQEQKEKEKRLRLQQQQQRGSNEKRSKQRQTFIGLRDHPLPQQRASRLEDRNKLRRSIAVLRLLRVLEGVYQSHAQWFLWMLLWKGMKVDTGRMQAQNARQQELIQLLINKLHETRTSMREMQGDFQRITEAITSASEGMNIPQQMEECAKRVEAFRHFQQETLARTRAELDGDRSTLNSRAQSVLEQYTKGVPEGRLLPELRSLDNDYRTYILPQLQSLPDISLLFLKGCIQAGRYSEAKACFDDAIGLATWLHLPDRHTFTLRIDRAYLHTLMGDTKAAIETYQTLANEIEVKRLDPYIARIVFNNLADCARMQGESEEARGSLENAAATSSDGPQPPELLMTLRRNEGILALDDEMCKTAIEKLIQALDVQKQEQKLPDDHLSLGYTWHALGAAYAKSDNASRAEEAWEKAIEIAKVHSNPELLLQCANSIGQLLKSYGKCREALEKMQEIFAYIPSAPVTPDVSADSTPCQSPVLLELWAAYHLNLGALYIRLDEASAAPTHFEKAYTYATKFQELCHDKRSEALLTNIKAWQDIQRHSN